MQIDGNDIQDAKDEVLSDVFAPYPLYEDEVEALIDAFIAKLVKKGR